MKMAASACTQVSKVNVVNEILRTCSAMSHFIIVKAMLFSCAMGIITIALRPHLESTRLCLVLFAS